MKTKCHVCEGEEFAVQGGFYYCTECHTQTQDLREQCDDMRDTVLFEGAKNRSKQTKIRTIKNIEDPTKVAWTSWEGFNFILVGLVDEIIGLGASPEIRLTTLQLWAAYLKKLEVAFISKEECILPKLSAAYKQQDRDILSGRIKKAKRKRKRVSSESDFTTVDDRIIRRRSKKKFKQAENKRMSQTTDHYSVANESIFSMKSTSATTNQSETRRVQFSRNAVKVLKNKMSKNHIKKHRIHADLSCHKMSANSFGSNYVQGPEHLTRSKLLAILYLALLVNEDDIQLGDLLRFIREGHLKYNSFQKYFPEDFNPTRKFENLFASGVVTTPNHLSLRSLAAKVAKFIDVKKLPAPNLYKLCERYCLELQLPQNLLPIIRKMIETYPPSFKTDKLTVIPNYEGRAMSYIVISLKLLFGLNGVTENFLSEQAEQMNNLDVPISQNDTDKSLSKLLLLDETLTEPRRRKTMFNWIDWVKYIEYRKVVLSNFHRPTKNIMMKEDTLEILEQWENLEQEEEEDSDDKKPNVKKDILMKMAREKESKETVFLKNLSASLTPFTSYMDVIVESNLKINDRVVRKVVFSDTDLSFVLEPNEHIYKQMKNVNKEVNKLKIKSDYFTYNVYRNKLQDLNKFVPISKFRATKIGNQSECPKKIKQKRTRLNGNGVELEEAYDVRLQEQIFYTTERNGRINGTITVNDRDTEMIGNDSDTEMIDNKSKPLKHSCVGKNYWLYHGLINKSVTDETFINIMGNLPDSFGWLLNECARTVEMKVKDLYEEVVLTEVIVCHVAKPLNEFWNEAVYSDTRAVDKPLANLIKKTKSNW